MRLRPNSNVIAPVAMPSRRIHVTTIGVGRRITVITVTAATCTACHFLCDTKA